MNTVQKNDILIRRRHLVICPPAVSTYRAGRAFVATMNRNLQDIGYTFAPKVITALSNTTERNAIEVFNGILEIVKKIRGVHRYNPMYPNFPKQVIDMDMAELYLNAIFHYFSVWAADVTGDDDYIWLPRYHKDKREPLNERVQLRVLNLGSDEDLFTLARQLATANTSLSETDKADLKALIPVMSEACAPPLEIPNKENLAFLASLYFDTDVDLLPWFKTATDVLRLAVAVSGGDVSLAEPTKFRKFKRKERRKLLALLNNCGNLEEDLMRWEGRWIKLSERLHPGDYWDKYAKAFSAIQAVRNGQTKQTFRSKVEEAVRAGHVVEAADLLRDRPGEFARRLDHLMRTARTLESKKNAILEFLSVAPKASTPVLLQLMAHFDHRDEGGRRTVFPKGNVAKAMTIDALPGFGKRDDGRTEYLSGWVSRGIRRVLRKRFSELPSLGKVYLDPDLKNYLLPFSQRSASKTMRTLVRGSHIPFGFNDKNTVRFFIHWHDMNSDKDSWNNRVDIDLSAVGYSEDWRNLGAITYYNLRENFACHSGDITSAPNGASEFIDVDIDRALANGFRYIVMNVNSYTGQQFCDVPECCAGWMLREKAQSGEVYDPRTVEDKADLTMEAKAGIPLILDLKERKVIWCDMAITVNRYASINVRNNEDTIALIGKALSKVNKATVYDLLYLHAKARGELVDKPKDADTVFSTKVGTQYETEKLASEFMADAPKKAKVLRGDCLGDLWLPRNSFANWRRSGWKRSGRRLKRHWN